MKYVVSVEGRAIEVEVDGERIAIGGQSYHATFSRIPGTPLRQLALDDRPVTLSVEPLGQGRWALSLAGERSEVEVLDERTRHIRTLTGSGDQRPKADVLRAPMPGMVVRINTRPGDSVIAGAGLVVLEAMKMENELKAGASGRVKAVRVNPGEAVEKGQVLLEFEGEK
ncbi:MAG TPA: biotin/lipoyl-containing protein [Gemmatimonadales bacterium]|nr:biotin/lipoyl-containing protein [Gemmatimonadales bacterium]